ncbi:[Wnt protein] O-palmitoleoyl-L-serine hydrolase [Trifolium repens]|nr:[Wnt protein] O-palmitoleoyl-L-serine hydrolase [Trifolium repens]
MIATRLNQAIYTLLVVCNLIISGRGVDFPYVTRLVNLTYLHHAVRQGVVCLDGSPPAYQFDKGFGDGVNNWLIFLEGGGWCDTTEDCLNRILPTGMGSSTNMFPKNFTGMTSNERSLNPYFYNWNRVYVHYCDGSSFTGNNFDPVHKLHYKGAKIFNVVVKDLLAKGMKNASNALLSGCSAGGLAAILNCDKFRSLLSTSTRVKCVSDAGYFPHLKDVLGGFRGMFISSCLIHCQYHLQQTWNGVDPRFRLHNKAMSEAVGKWFDGKAELQRIDRENDLPRVCLTL